MARMKKAQMGYTSAPKAKKATDKTRSEMGGPKRKGYDKLEMEMINYQGRVPMRRPVSTPKRKMKKGGSFPDLNKDGKITKADVLVGRGVIKAKKRSSLKKKAKGGMSVTKMANLKGGGKCKYGCK
jgi:hypothetical protein